MGETFEVLEVWGGVIRLLPHRLCNPPTRLLASREHTASGALLRFPNTRISASHLVIVFSFQTGSYFSDKKTHFPSPLPLLGVAPFLYEPLQHNAPRVFCVLHHLLLASSVVWEPGHEARGLAMHLELFSKARVTSTLFRSVLTFLDASFLMRSICPLPGVQGHPLGHASFFPSCFSSFSLPFWLFLWRTHSWSSQLSPWSFWSLLPCA